MSKDDIDQLLMNIYIKHNADTEFGIEDDDDSEYDSINSGESEDTN